MTTPNTPPPSGNMPAALHTAAEKIERLRIIGEARDKAVADLNAEAARLSAAAAKGGAGERAIGLFVLLGFLAPLSIVLWKWALSW